MRLLLAEDEADLAEALGVFFEKNHFSYPRTGISTICSTSSAKGRTPAHLPGSCSPAHAAAAGAAEGAGQSGNTVFHALFHPDA